MKRFTATEKWEKTWFQELPPHLKCLWQYMCDKCDAAGVWEPNWKIATMFIGKPVSDADLIHFSGKVAKAKGGKIVIGSFIEFQYGKLSEECRAHIPVFRLLDKHRVSIGYQEAIDSLKEQEEETEKEKDTEEETERPKAIRKDRGTIEEISEFVKTIGLPVSDAIALFNKWEGNGWKNGQASIKCWRSTIKAWKEQHYLPSQKNGNGNKSGGLTETITPNIIRFDD